ncbi:MAG TPA: patatin-like phospholipase family protein [Solirubrobacterales bacterium]|nr:patatin-like phospholipase family protein [Solirubrobacterales bacterium]
MAETLDKRRKRSLIMAGGGVKVAFQAGALQVLFDEAEGLEFDHIDAASGGSFNLAMRCQQMTGKEIADNWRRFGPLRIVQPNPRFLLGESIARLEALRDNGFTDWGLDFAAIRASTLEATFNTYDFSRHELMVLEPEDMTPEMLMACVALPMWFPPIEHAGDVLIDPVYITDANLDEAIRRGADELWVIWTVSRQGRWRRGFIHHYFQVIETAAYGHFKRMLERIEASNQALQQGRHSEFDRQIEVKILYAEVPLHYLLNFRRGPFRRAVETGVEAARGWCRHEGVPLRSSPPLPTRPAKTVRFTEVMAGSVTFGEDGSQSGTKSPLRFKLTMHVDDLETFLKDPEHEAVATGFVECPALGGRRVVSHGRFNLFTEGSAPGLKHMRYRLFFRDREGRALTLTGVKDIRDDQGFDTWPDTTTLDTRILDGHVAPGSEGALVAQGILRITLLAFARQLSTFRGAGPGLLGGTRAVLRFGHAFVGNLYSVYLPGQRS